MLSRRYNLRKKIFYKTRLHLCHLLKSGRERRHFNFTSSLNHPSAIEKYYFSKGYFFFGETWFVSLKNTQKVLLQSLCQKINIFSAFWC